MERRALTRQSLFLTAQLVRTGVGTLPCTIRNFCTSGLFLSLEGPNPVEVDDSVQVLFNTELAGENRDFRLRARVSGDFNEGIGCEFFDPDPEAIRALQTLADKPQSEPAPGPAPVGPPLPDAAPLISSCKERLSNYLTPQLEAMFSLADESLFLSARDATSNAQQNLYFDTQKEVTRFKDPVQDAFFAVIVSQMDTLGAPLTAMQEPEEDKSSSGLSLVESGEFADWLAVKQIYSRAEPGVREDQYKIEKRLETLSGASIDEDNNPLGLAVLCHTFHDALQTIQTPRLARRVVFQSFDETVIENLKGFYDELNEFFEQSGVLTNLETPKPVVTKTPGASPDHPPPTTGPDFQPPAPDQVAGHPSSPSWGNTTPTPVAGSGSPHPGESATLPGGNFAAATPGQTGGFAQPQNPQTAGFGAETHPAPAATVVGAPGQVAFPGKQTGVGVAAPASGQEPIGSPPGAVMDEMAPHPSLASGIPFDPRQVVSGNVYSSPMDITHSAYETAQALMGLRRQILHSDPQSESLPTYEPEQVKGALTLLQKQEASQPAGSTGPDLKTRVMRALRSRHGYADKKDIPEREQAAIDLIGQLVESVVADTLVTNDLKPQLRRLEVPLLNVAMQDPGFFATPSHPARQVVNRIAQVSGAKDGSLAGGVARNVDSVMERIVNHSAEDSDVFVESVRKLDTVLAQQTATRQANINEVVRSCDEQQALIKSRAGNGGPKTNERELPEEWRQWLSRTKRLQVGDAMMLDKNTDNPQHGALAWVGEDHATYVFVDNQGLKASTLSLNELAMQLRRGQADVIPETDLPAMDRGLYSMLRNMHEEVLKQANRDELTELLNRREFDNRLDTAAAAARRDNTSHALCLMDLDHFHVINDTCGRKAGDRLLKEVGKVLLKTMGDAGELARLGEDKFGVLLKDVTEDGAFEVAEKQRAAIEKFRVTWKGERLQLTISTGLTEVSGENQGSRAIQEALARERAKSAGGNRIDIYRAQDEETDRGDSADKWVSRIEQTLDKNQLVLRCQKFTPVAEDSPDKPHYEILLGVLDEKGQMTLPGEFIQAAELYDKIIEVDSLGNCHRIQLDG